MTCSETSTDNDEGDPRHAVLALDARRTGPVLPRDARARGERADRVDAVRRERLGNRRQARDRKAAAAGAATAVRRVAGRGDWRPYDADRARARPARSAAAAPPP